MPCNLHMLFDFTIAYLLMNMEFVAFAVNLHGDLNNLVYRENSFAVNFNSVTLYEI